MHRKLSTFLASIGGSPAHEPARGTLRLAGERAARPVARSDAGADQRRTHQRLGLAQRQRYRLYPNVPMITNRFFATISQRSTLRHEIRVFVMRSAIDTDGLCRTAGKENNRIDVRTRRRGLAGNSIDFGNKHNIAKTPTVCTPGPMDEQAMRTGVQIYTHRPCYPRMSTNQSKYLEKKTEYQASAHQLSRKIYSLLMMLVIYPIHMKHKCSQCNQSVEVSITSCFIDCNFAAFRSALKSSICFFRLVGIQTYWV